MYYAFKNEPITSCGVCPFYDSYFNVCGKLRLSIYDEYKIHSHCPLKLATGVEEVTPENIKKRQYIDSAKDVKYDDGER